MLIPALRTLKACSASQRSCAPSQHRCEELSTRLHTYTFRHRLGRGAFGQVFLAEVVDDTAPTFGRKKHGNRLVAVKIIRRAKLEKESTRALARAEAENLRRISEAKSLFFTQLRETFSDGHNLYIVTDFLTGGTLRREMNRYYRKGKCIPNDRIVLIMAQLVEAISQIHELRIVHRDIKPDNILLDCRGNVVLADFGLSRRFEMAVSEDEPDHDAGDGWRCGRKMMMCNSHLSIFKSHREKDALKVAEITSASQGEVVGETGISDIAADKSCLTDTGCGTLSYAAPEMHRGEPYSFSADVYSLGVVFHELLFDMLPPYPPVEHESIDADEEWFLDNQSMKTQEVEIDPVAFQLLKSLLALNPLKRISIPELRSHSFFSGVHWTTLAAQAYVLPHYHSPPPFPIKLLPTSAIVNPGVFVDPLAVLEDGPDRALDNAFNVQGCSRMKQRPDGKCKRWKTSEVGKALLAMQTRTMQIWDFARGRKRRAAMREWSRDVENRTVTLAKIVDLKSSPRPENIAPERLACTKTEVDSVNEELSGGNSRSSIVASAGHSSPNFLESEPIRRVLPEYEQPRRLRRVIARIPPRSRQVPSIQTHIPSPTLDLAAELMDDAKSDTESGSDLFSTIAVFARSFADSDDEVDLNPQAFPRRRTRPVLARISTDLPPCSPDASASSSSPFPSLFSLSLFLSRALEHVLPSSPPAILASAEEQEKSGLDAGLPLPDSSCPSLLPSSSLSASAVSSLLPTPVRGNSHLPGDVQTVDDKSLLGRGERRSFSKALRRIVWSNKAPGS